jgi:hypothetical protein
MVEAQIGSASVDDVEKDFWVALEYQGGRRPEWANEARKARRRRSPTNRDIATVAADKYFLLLAAAQLNKCVAGLPNDGLPTLQEADLLELLRNLEEHWEDPTGRSGTALRKLIPDIKPGRLHYNKHDIWIEGISVVGLLQWAEEVDRRIRETLTDPGPPN